MQGPARIATSVALVLTLAGFSTIAMAWNFAAELDYIQGQFPYFLSGGLAGLGLVVCGVALLAVQVQRGLAARRVRDLDRLQAALDDLLEALDRREREGR